MYRPRHILVRLFTAALLITGCGSATTAQPPTSVDTRAAAAAAQLAALSSAQASAEADTTVPELFRFAAGTVKGDVVDGRTLVGKKTMIWFWASWCPICAAEVGNVRLSAKRVRDLGVDVLTVAGLASPQVEAMVWADQHLIGALTNLHDADGDLYLRFEVLAQDTFVFVNSDGTMDQVNKSLSADDIVSAAELLT